MNIDRQKVYFVSLGCPKNQVDTEVMLGVVRDEGHELVDSPEHADVLVVNTCGFIEEAKQESIDTILQLAQVKVEAGPHGGKRLVVAGCLSQRHSHELARELPEVDHLLGSADMLGLGKVLRGEAPRMGVSKLGSRAWIYDHQTPRRLIGRTHTAYVKIAEGCDRPCAFCIIPQLRGAQRSRTIFGIVEEVHGLVEAGTREICLVAQDLTTYGSDLSPPATLEQLLDALSRITGLTWIRLHYAYPNAVSPGLIERICHEPRIATYIDVPMQHVDSDVLKRMRRGYGEKQVRTLVEALRSCKPHVWLRTTLLVGHPGESDAAFQRLYEFVEDGHIDHLGVFAWSREQGTPSAMQPDRIDPALVEERRLALLELHEDQRTLVHQGMIGNVIEVMIDGCSDESDLLLEGRHQGQAPGIDGKVILADGTGCTGELCPARITQADAFDLVASLEL